MKKEFLAMTIEGPEVEPIVHNGADIEAMIDMVKNAGLMNDDPWLFKYVTESLASGGFEIGLESRKAIIKRRNMQTTLREKIEITKWLMEKIKSGYVWGPMKEEVATKAVGGVISQAPMGAVPKKGGKIRPIMNLSAEVKGISINSQIPEKNKKIKYLSFKELVRLVFSTGIGGWLFAVDAKEAYMQVPVARDDWRFLGVRWLNRLCIFICLCFGLASAPKIYTHFADAIEHVICQSDPELFGCSKGAIQLLRHYLDDFVGGASKKSLADKQFQLVLECFRLMGIKTAPKKLKPPATTQILLGFEFNTVEQVVRIPKDKCDEMVKIIRRMIKKRKGRGYPQLRKRKLAAIIGKVRWASAAIYTGQAFVRRLEALIYTGGTVRWGHRVKLTQESVKDLMWWLDAINSRIYNGFDLKFILKREQDGDIVIYTDAASTLGMGWVSSTGHWFQMSWDDFEDIAGFRPIDIMAQEMMAVALAVAALAIYLPGKSLKVFCDNMGCVESLIRKRCVLRRDDCMDLIRKICLKAVEHQFYFWVEWVPTDDNKLADGLSRLVENPLAAKQDDFVHEPFNESGVDASETIREWFG